MEKPTSKFGSTIPELKEVITKHGCGLGRGGPPYIVFGQYSSKASGPIAGILAAAQNEFFAHAIMREVNKNGSSVVHRTEYHPDPTFSIAEYKAKIKEKMDAQKLADEQAELAEKVAANTPPFKLELVK